MNQTPNYLKLEQELQKITHLGNILSLAYWDSATYLPSNSATVRQEEIATVSAILHEMTSSSAIGKLIGEAEDESDRFDEWQLANLREVRKSYDHATCISSEIQHEHTRLTGECEYIWRTARIENDWKKLEPYLDKVFASVKKIAKLKADKFGTDEYDILVDSFDPERKSAEISKVYDALKTNLPDLIKKIVERQSTEKTLPLTEKINEKTQREIGLAVMEVMGFDMNRGRLDTSVHPFCSGTNDDVRITTRYDESNFLSSLCGVIHEAGHGLYQLNLPKERRNQPVGGAKGMAFHESQSLIMEMQVGSSKAFAEYLAKLLKDRFNFTGAEYSADNLYLLLTRVEPSLIRVDADEVTYPLHVIIRFEIEKAIMAGDLKTRDLPTYWNEKMRQYLGVVPDNDKNGCMQDIHWPSGWFGYFPSYTNGAIIASMLMKAAKDKQPAIGEELREGNFTSLNNYLNKTLRNYGSVKGSGELLEISTGHRQIKPEIFLDYLKAKYL